MDDEMDEEQNPPKPKQPREYAMQKYVNKSYFTFDLFGKQTGMMHEIAGNMSKVFTSRKWKDYQKWIKVNHMINGTVVPVKGKSSEKFASCDTKNLLQYRFNGNGYINLHIEFLKALFGETPGKAQRDLWSYVAAPQVAHIHKYVVVLGYMFVVQPGLCVRLVKKLLVNNLTFSFSKS
uniref:Uncharacterized protein n=1 Tax=Panagrolaimus davidi TaxID=227884 RepID=A0A914QRW0_9BILA